MPAETLDQPPRRPEDAAKPTAPPKVYATAEELLADMPRDAFPDGDAIEWAACEKWCEANLVRRSVSWTAKVANYEVAEGANGFDVTIDTDEPMVEGGIVLGDPVQMGKSKWGVVLSGFYMFSGNPKGTYDLGDHTLRLRYEKCTAEEAKTLRAMKGREVAFRANIEKPFEWGNAVKVKGDKRARSPARGSPFDDKELDWLPIRCHISHPSIDGFLPAAHRPPAPAEPIAGPKGGKPETAKPDRPAEDDSNPNGITPKKQDYYVDDKLTVRGKVQFLIDDSEYKFEPDPERRKKLKVKVALIVREGGYQLFCWLPETTGAEYERLQARLTGKRVRVTGKVTLSMGRELWLGDCEATLIK